MNKSNQAMLTVLGNLSEIELEVDLLMKPKSEAMKLREVYRKCITEWTEWTSMI